MVAPIEERLLVTMFVGRFGNGSMSWFGSAISAQLSKDDFTWELMIARLLHEYVSHQISKYVSSSTMDIALASFTQKGTKKEMS